MLDFFFYNLSWFWLGITIVCVVIEALSFSLTTIWFAISGAVMIFVSRTPLPFRWQLLIFLVLSIALLVLTRPFMIKKLKLGTKPETNADLIIGQEVVVTKAVREFEKGEVKTGNGVIWSAASANHTAIPEQTVCIVESIHGNTLSVIIKQ
jgi:Membrane protein implicated in regulation of membrane protease activity